MPDLSRSPLHDRHLALGAKLAELLEVPVFGFWRTLTAAVAGAVVIIVIWNAARGRR